jgi:hypothetical protein
MASYRANVNGFRQDAILARDNTQTASAGHAEPPKRWENGHPFPTPAHLASDLVRAAHPFRRRPTGRTTRDVTAVTPKIE